MKNIDTAFQHIRIFTMLIIVGCLFLCCFVTCKSYNLVTDMQNKVYVLAQTDMGSRAIQATASDRKENIAVEARDHVKMFHEYFFALDPDDQVITTGITKALYLADASAKREYDNLKEKGYYANLISSNISQQIKVDSVTIETGGYPYYFRCYATQRIIRATTILSRNLITEGYLRNVSRSDHNPHGFLIERWKILENKDLKVQNR
ncbi:MAG: conjugative transposon protein TraK [Chitinophagaceae bacterium]